MKLEWQAFCTSVSFSHLDYGFLWLNCSSVWSYSGFLLFLPSSNYIIIKFTPNLSASYDWPCPFAALAVCGQETTRSPHAQPYFCRPFFTHLLAHFWIPAHTAFLPTCINPFPYTYFRISDGHRLLYSSVSTVQQPLSSFFFNISQLSLLLLHRSKMSPVFLNVSLPYLECRLNDHHWPWLQSGPWSILSSCSLWHSVQHHTS